jgi:hypothetical protein
MATATMARRTMRVAYIFSLIDGIYLTNDVLQKYPNYTMNVVLQFPVERKCRVSFVSTDIPVFWVSTRR